MKTLLAFTVGLLDNTFSGDVVELAAYKAESLSKEMGVSEEDFKEVMKLLVQIWENRKGPMHWRV